MSITDLINLIKLQGVNIPIYPLEFPATSPDEALIVETAQSFNSRGSLYEGTISITARATHPNRAEAIAQGLNEKLHLLSDEQAGDMQVVLIKSLNPIPAYLGTDKGNKYYFMVSYQVLLT